MRGESGAIAVTAAVGTIVGDEVMAVPVVVVAFGEAGVMPDADAAGNVYGTGKSGCTSNTRLMGGGETTADFATGAGAGAGSETGTNVKLDASVGMG